MQMDGFITGFVAMGLTCSLVILGLGELAANPYSYSGTQSQTTTAKHQ
jgi:hypothetical protein